MKLVKKTTNTPSTTGKARKASTKRNAAKSNEEEQAPIQIDFVVPGLERPDVTPQKYRGSLSSRKRNRPEFVVTLDEASFRYVWEMLEARGKTDYQRYSSVDVIKDCVTNSLNAFRRSYASGMGIKPPVTKRLVKKAAAK